MTNVPTPTTTNTTPGGVIRRQRNRTGERISRAVFTLNNYTPEEYSYLTEEFAPKCSWMVVAKEKGESGTLHLQGTHLNNGFRFCDHCGSRARYGFCDWCISSVDATINFWKCNCGTSVDEETSPYTSAELLYCPTCDAN